MPTREILILVTNSKRKVDHAGISGEEEKLNLAAETIVLDKRFLLFIFDKMRAKVARNLAMIEAEIAHEKSQVRR